MNKRIGLSRRTSLGLLSVALLQLSFVSCALLHTELKAEAMQLEELPTALIFQEPTVRVLLGHKSKGSMLEVAGRYSLVDPKGNKRVSQGLFGSRFAVRPSANGLLWGEEFTKIYQLKLIPRGKDRLFWVDGVQYTGVLYIYQIGDTISLVNELPIESYVAAIVQSNGAEEMLPEAANALAICARSDAWYHLKTRPEAYWQIFAQEVGFRGIGGLNQDSMGSVASEATKGLYLTHAGFNQNHGLFLSRWTGHSAGRTVSFNQLNQEPREIGDFNVDSTIARLDRDRTQWHSFLTQEQIEKAFDLSPGTLLDFMAVQDPVTQKVHAIVLKTTGQIMQVSYFKAVQALGSDKLQSSEFTVKQLPGLNFQCQGYGQGSGVGLCLYSAEKMAEQGKNAPQILEQFFPGSKIEMLRINHKP